MDNNITYIEDVVNQLMRILREHVPTAADEDLQRWLNSAEEMINTLEELINCQKLRRSEKQKCQTSLTHLYSARNQLRASLQKQGGDLQQQQQQDEPTIRWDEMPSAFERRIQSRVISNLGHLDVVSFLDEAKSLFKDKIKATLQQTSALKVNAELSGEYVIHKNDSEAMEIKYFNTENASIFKTTDLEECFNDRVAEPIMQQMEEFEERGSGWTLIRILSLVININQLNAMKGSSYINLPDVIKKKNACINVENKEDEECFKWAILSARHDPKQSEDPEERKKTPRRVSTYEKYKDELDFSGITFPVAVKQVAKFEKQNPISVNVYLLNKKGKDNYKISPCHVTSAYQEEH